MFCEFSKGPLNTFLHGLDLDKVKQRPFLIWRELKIPFQDMDVGAAGCRGPAGLGHTLTFPSS